MEREGILDMETKRSQTMKYGDPTSSTELGGKIITGIYRLMKIYT